MRYPDVPFLEAAQYTKAAGSNGRVTRIVIHDMEIAEGNTTAESCANMFHTTTRQASAHFCVDNNSIIQCVDLDRRAWHAPPNSGSIGIEHAGYASQTRSQWLDPYGIAMLTRSAALTAWLCKVLDIPIVKLSAGDLLNGKHGITGHAEVSAAWHQTDHTDPGTGFPWNWYLSQVQSHYDGTGDIPVTDAEIDEVATKAMQKVWSYVVPGQTASTAVLLKHAYDQSALNTQLLQALQAAEAGDDIDVDELAHSIAAMIPVPVLGAVDPAALASAVADKIHDRMAS